MQFLVLGRDGTDENAPQRRLAARSAHLALFRTMIEKGVFLYGSAILNDDGEMVGSMILCDFPSRAALEAEWLAHEPYIVGEVWKTVEIHRAQIPPFLLTAAPHR